MRGWKISGFTVADCVSVRARNKEHKTALLIKINDGQMSRRNFVYGIQKI